MTQAGIVERSRQQRQWARVLVGVIAASSVAITLGVPSAMLPNPFFVRMTPTPWWGYAAWVASAILSGILAATYVASARPNSSGSVGGAGIVANVGSFLAVGCPVCNKLVVAALGVSGALSIWAPIQPLLALTSLALLVWVVWRRFKNLRSCPSDVAPIHPLVPAASRSEPGGDG